MKMTYKGILKYVKKAQLIAFNINVKYNTFVFMLN